MCAKIYQISPRPFGTLAEIRSTFFTQNGQNLHVLRKKLDFFLEKYNIFARNFPMIFREKICIFPIVFSKCVIFLNLTTYYSPMLRKIYSFWEGYGKYRFFLQNDPMCFPSVYILYATKQCILSFEQGGQWSQNETAFCINNTFYI